ncbi:SoxR reducing system RseC family protein [Serratia ureilytica]
MAAAPRVPLRARARTNWCRKPSISRRCISISRSNLGQRVEVGIAEGSLLRSAMLVYPTPLLGMMLGGTLLYIARQRRLGGRRRRTGGGGLLARRLARRLGEQADTSRWCCRLGCRLPRCAWQENFADLNRRPRHRRVVIGGDAAVIIGAPAAR